MPSKNGVLKLNTTTMIDSQRLMFGWSDLLITGWASVCDCYVVYKVQGFQKHFGNISKYSKII